MNEKDKDAGGLAAARRMRGPAAARNYRADESDKLAYEAVHDNRMPEDWAYVAAGKMTMECEPSDIRMFERRAANIMRSVFNDIEASTRRRVARAEAKLDAYYQAEIKKLKNQIAELEAKGKE